MLTGSLNEGDAMMCYDACTDVVSYNGIECRREEAAVGAQLGETSNDGSKWTMSDKVHVCRGDQQILQTFQNQLDFFDYGNTSYDRGLILQNK